jgi:predicted dehydrogenase
MYRAAIVGAGRIGTEFQDSHARAYHVNPNTELLAIFDKRFNKAYEAAMKWEVPVMGDQYWGIGELGIDIVSICTPPQTHLEIVKDMLMCNQGLQAIYCEKPITIDLDEAKEMIALCREANVLLQINHQRRFGRPTFTFSRGIFNTGTHMVDMLRQYFGEVMEVSKNTLQFRDITVDIQELDIEKPVFEFKIPTHDLIVKGVEHLVDCIENKHDSISNGETALATLEVLWELKKLS